MLTYSTPSQIDDFLAQLGLNPLTVCDMDGNVMLGYNLTASKPPFKLAKGEDPKFQTIPFGTGADQLEASVKKNHYARAIFANKAMDARLPPELVELVNASLAQRHAFRMAFLTSRGFDHAQRLLRESGVVQLDRVTLVADSGATIQINGERFNVRELSRDEHAHIRRLDTMALSLRDDVQDILTAQGFAVTCPALTVEHKSIASNLHYREILDAAGQAEGSPLDAAIAAHLKARLNAHAEAGPREADGTPSFKTLDGPATVELKIASINKSHGLEAIIQRAQSHAMPPSAVVFTGDDVTKGNGTPGTDYFAMRDADKLAKAYGLKVLTIHTHHPLGTTLDGTIPDPDKSPAKLLPQYPQPRIDLTVPTPPALAAILLRAHSFQPRLYEVQAARGLTHG